jgi:hypothetical protein
MLRVVRCLPLRAGLAGNNSGQRAGVGQASREETAGRTDVVGRRLPRYGDLTVGSRSEGGEEAAQSIGAGAAVGAAGVDTPEFEVRRGAGNEAIAAQDTALPDRL